MLKISSVDAVVFADSLRHAFGGRSDIVARLGGEEFAIVIPRTDIEGARAAFARARALVAEMVQRQGSIPFTASYGIATARRSLAIPSRSPP